MSNVQRLLLVDDDPLIADALSVALERDGREIIVCADIESAEIVVERRDIHCVVSDVRLTGSFRFEGLDFIRDVKRHRPHCVVVLITGAPSDELTREALTRGAAAVLPKPFEVAQLESWIGDPESHQHARVITMPPLEAIIAGGELVPHFQPIVDLDGNGHPHGYESLARFRSESIFRFPDALFAYAAKKHRVLDLELACIRQTFAHCAPLAARGARIFINLHPSVIGSGRLLALLDRCSADAGVAPSQVVLEITEQQSLGHADGVARDCEALRAHGFSFALDDVGVAYSHLAHIDAILPRYLKISPEFGSAFETDATKIKIVRNVLSLAKDFDCQLVLEGIETAATRDAAMKERIRLAQGYFFARPLPAAEIAAGDSFRS